MNQQRILFLTIQLPFPPKSGGTVKSWNYIQHLSQNHLVSVATLLKDDDKDHVEDFKKAIKIEHFEGEELFVSRSPLNLIKSYLTAPCLNVFRNYSNHFKRKISYLFELTDVIIVDHYEVFQYVPSSYRGKVILHTHNAEFMLWQRMSELTNNPVKKLILRIEAYRVKRFENNIFKKSDLVYSTPSDIQLYKKHGLTTQKHAVTYHLGNDSLLELPDLEFHKTEKAITFIGTLSWEPNIDGICWFIENCWKTIKEKHSDVVLYILGGSADPRIIRAANNDSSIIFTGFVKELDTYLQKTRVYIAPLRFGSGMKVKVLEGLYRGNPCVTTSVGAEGLAIEDGQEIFIRDNADDFAAQCVVLLENKSVWTNMRDNARKVANVEYKWANLFRKMDVSMQSMLK